MGNPRPCSASLPDVENPTGAQTSAGFLVLFCFCFQAGKHYTVQRVVDILWPFRRRMQGRSWVFWVGGQKPGLKCIKRVVKSMLHKLRCTFPCGCGPTSNRRHSQENSTQALIRVRQTGKGGDLPHQLPGWDIPLHTGGGWGGKACALAPPCKAPEKNNNRNFGSRGDTPHPQVPSTHEPQARKRERETGNLPLFLNGKDGAASLWQGMKG